MSAKVWEDPKTGKFYVKVNDKRLPKGRKAYLVKSESEAITECRRLNKALRDGSFNFDVQAASSSKDCETLKEYFEKFCKMQRGAFAARTLESYEGNFENHILPKLGAKKLNEITREDVSVFVSNLVTGKKLSRASVRIVCAELCALFNHAIEHQKIDSNPARKLTKLYKHARKSADIEPLSEAESMKFLAKVAEVAPRYYPLFLAAAHTGMRSGELASLKWTDVDFSSHLLSVFATKTSKRRKIDMSESLEKTFKALKAERAKRFRRAIPEHVFCNQNGGRIDMHNVKTRHFHRLLELAEVRSIRFHDLRHTFATQLIMRGESLAYVKDQLGHSSITLTVNTYTHWLQGSNRKAVNALPACETPENFESNVKKFEKKSA